jgi:small neutral amino acid transporter SnatA (MarC family)
MKAKPILVTIIIIAMIIVYFFLCCHVFLGLWEATALQAFSGLFVMIIAGVAVGLCCVGVPDWFK